MTPDGRRITAVIIDDHTLFRDGVRELLSTQPEIEIVAEGGDGDDAVALASRHRPDVVLLDVAMPGPPPQVVIPQIRMLCPEARVVVLTMHGDPELAHELLTLGARAYLVKDVSREQLFGAVHTVMHDDERTILASSKQSLASLYQSEHVDSPGLTAREREVLELVARGMTNTQIGSALDIAEGTVRRHLSNAYRRLGASGRVDAINRAVAAGVFGGRGTRPAPPPRAPGRPAQA